MIRRRYNWPENGFTLLEVMIAVAIIAIALVTLLGAQGRSVSLVTGAGLDMEAALLAERIMGDLLAEREEVMANEAGEEEVDGHRFTWQVEIEDLGKEETGITGIDGLLKRMTVTVTGPEGRAYVLTTLRAELPEAESIR